MKKALGGVKHSKGMKKEVGSHKVSGYPKGKQGSSMHAHAIESAHSMHNSNADGGEALAPLKCVDDYHPQG